MSETLFFSRFPVSVIFLLPESSADSPQLKEHRFFM